MMRRKSIAKRARLNSTPAAAPGDGGKDGKHDYVLRLYIAGMSARSSRAVMNIKEICENSLSSHYDLEVIDIYQQPNWPRASRSSRRPLW
jgi:hypothetical protein